MHCSQAVFRSLFSYFFNEEFTWAAIDQITKTIQGKGSWTMAAEIELAKRGIEVINIEPFDYQQYYEQGLDYLNQHFNQEIISWYINKSNLLSVRDDIPTFLKLVKHETRKATIGDIDTLLNKGYLIGAEINSRILNNKPGFSLHYVLVKGKENSQYIVNDPGGGSSPSQENRKVSVADFIAALGKEGSNGEVTAFKNISNKNS
jgi:hypothetical protein